MNSVEKNIRGKDLLSLSEGVIISTDRLLIGGDYMYVLIRGKSINSWGRINK